MTVAITLAIRSSSGQAGLAVIADSRLSLGNGRQTDDFVKAIELGPTSIVAVAGDSTLPAAVAAEVSRPLIRNLHANRKKEGQQASLLEEARQFASFHGVIHKNLERPRVGTALAGTYADGSPGVVRLELHGQSGRIMGFRPVVDGAAAVGVGSPSAVGLAIDALRLRSPRSLDAAISLVASVVWAEMCDDTVPGIGGRLLIGSCLPPQPWNWPVVQVEDQLFYRGFPMEVVPSGWEREFHLVNLDRGLRDAIAEERESAPYPLHVPGPVFSVIDSEEVQLALPSDWRLSPAEQSVLGLSP